MAFSIQASVSLVALGSFPMQDTDAFAFDMTSGLPAGPIPQTIGTSDEVLAIPADVPNCKFLKIVNVDPTNYVQLSYTSGGGFSSFSRLDPNGGTYFGRPESLTIYAKANTAACLVKFSIAPQ
jgi:hypothetical protein